MEWKLGPMFVNNIIKRKKRGAKNSCWFSWWWFSEIERNRKKEREREKEKEEEKGWSTARHLLVTCTPWLWVSFPLSLSLLILSLLSSSLVSSHFKVFFLPHLVSTLLSTWMLSAANTYYLQAKDFVDLVFGPEIGSICCPLSLSLSISPHFFHSLLLFGSFTYLTLLFRAAFQEEVI